MVLRTLRRCCPWLSCSKKKKEPKSVIKVDTHFCKQNFIFSIKTKPFTNIKTSCVGWTTVQLIHRHTAQVNTRCSYFRMTLSVKSIISSKMTKLNLWLPISTKMPPRYVHISGWPCTRLTPKTISNHHLLLGAQFSRNCCRTFCHTGTRGGALFISLARKQNPEQSTLSSVKKEKKGKIIRWCLVTGNFLGGSILQAPAVAQPSPAPAPAPADTVAQSFVKDGRRGEGRLPMVIIANWLNDQQTCTKETRQPLLLAWS